MYNNNWRGNGVNANKVVFLISLCVIALCAVNIQPIRAQETTIIYILSDGSFQSSTGIGAPIQKEGKVYTLTDNLVGYSLVVQCTNITIDGAGFSLSGDGEVGIDLSNINYVTIKDLLIQGSYYYGIRMMVSSDITILGNTITGNNFGIYISNSTRNTILGNTIKNNGVGINMMSSSNLVFRNNGIENNQNIAVYGTLLSHFANDIDVSNTINGKKVYYLIDEKNLVITPDTFPDIGMLALVSCTNITVQNIQLTDNGQGLIMAYTTNSKIVDNTISENYNGILIFSASNNEVTGNTITNSYRALQISKSSKNNRINNNNITDNKEGILLFDSSLNTFVGNIFQNNEMAMGFSSSSSNTIYGNYFINNNEQFYDTSMQDSSTSNSMNYWYFDYPIGGNYWSDYIGFDLKSGANQDQEGSDNIGDTPYIIYENIKDEYPLLPFGSPLAVSIVSPENKTYNSNSVPLTYTTSKTELVIGYSLDGQTNITVSESITLSSLSDGPHKLTVYAKDTEGNGTSDTVYFTISEEAETPTDTEETEELPITLIAAAIGVLAAVGVALLYFMKIKKK